MVCVYTDLDVAITATEELNPDPSFWVSAHPNEMWRGGSPTYHLRWTSSLGWDLLYRPDNTQHYQPGHPLYQPWVLKTGDDHPMLCGPTYEILIGDARDTHRTLLSVFDVLGARRLKSVSIWDTLQR